MNELFVLAVLLYFFRTMAKLHPEPGEKRITKIPRSSPVKNWRERRRLGDNGPEFPTDDKRTD